MRPNPCLHLTNAAIAAPLPFVPGREPRVTRTPSR